MKILIAEDDTNIVEAYKDALETRNHEIILTENGEECLKKYQTEALTMQQSGYLAEQQNRKNCGSYGRHKSNATVPFDVVILDYKMPKKMDYRLQRKSLNLTQSKE